jgi:hypothetical protein
VLSLIGFGTARGDEMCVPDIIAKGMPAKVLGIYYKSEGYHGDVPVYRENRTTDPFTGVEKKWFEIASGDKWRQSDPLASTQWFRDAKRTKFG